MVNLAVHVFRILFFYPLLIHTSNAYAQNTLNWVLESDGDEILIHSRPHKEGLVEIRARTVIPTSYGAFMMLLEDTNNVPNWIDNVKHSRVLKKLSQHENIVYTQFSAPWPASNRDMVTYSSYYIDEHSFTLTIKDATKDMMPKQQGYIRIHSVSASWSLQKLTDGKTLIEYTAFANPGGALPNWLINRLAKQSAKKTFLKLREQLPRYQGLLHPSIKD